MTVGTTTTSHPPAGGTTLSDTTTPNNNNNNVNQNPITSRLVYGKDDALFGAIEQLQGNLPFGRMLDAGTGLHSLRWMATLLGTRNDIDNKDGDADGHHHDNPITSSLDGRGMTHFTAVTADSTMRLRVQNEVDSLGISEWGDVVLGNWFVVTDDATAAATAVHDDHNMDRGSTSSSSSSSISIEKALQNQEESYDTILADYLIGAMDGFSPYYQDQMIPKLCKYLKPGGNLYIVGLEPIPDPQQQPSSATTTTARDLIGRVRQVRDACILLAGHRCYREYPLHWIRHHVASLEDECGITLGECKTFPILYRHETICKQINVGRSKLSYFASTALAESMKTVLDDLERQSKEMTDRSANGRIQLGFDYVVRVTKKPIR